MAVFVLVHGGGHGGWCYAKVTERLQARGHRVYVLHVLHVDELTFPFPEPARFLGSERVLHVRRRRHQDSYGVPWRVGSIAVRRRGGRLGPASRECG